MPAKYVLMVGHCFRKELFVSTDFVKLKSKMRLSLILKSLVFALSLGVISASVYIIVLKIATKTPNPLISVIIGAGVFLSAFLVLLLIIRPTEKRLARSLDEKLALGEKVQTMIEFADEEGGMIELQREDAHLRIKNAPRSALAAKRPYLHIIAPLLAVALLLPAFLMGVRKPDVPPPPIVPADTSDEWALTDWHKTSVRLLIEEVRESKLIEEGKTEIISELERLLLDLAPIKSKTQMKKIVIDAMIAIDGVVDDINTFSGLKTALVNSVSGRVKELAEAIGTPNDPIIESKYSLLQVELGKENAVSQLSEFSAALKLVYDAAGEKEKADKLYVSVKNLSDAAKALSETLAAPDFSGDKDALFLALFQTAGEEISAALMEQKNNRDTSDNAINSLMNIFGIDYSEIPEDLKYGDDGEAGGVTGDDSNKKDDEHIVTGGGKGEGENLYASDDMIFDKDKDEYVKYGDVIDSYDVKKTDVVNNSSLPDSIKDAISKYFGDLYYNKDKN